jgi:hypothetical protein
LELSSLEFLWLWFEGTWITCFVVEDLLEILWFGKESYLKFAMIWSQNFVGVKGLRFVLLVGSSLTCIFIVIWGNESCFKFRYNLKLNFFHCKWACNLFRGSKLLWNLLQFGVDCCEGLEICFKFVFRFTCLFV